MTNIYVKKQGCKYNIVVDGHASESHTADGNVVCAAVSMLVQTLAQNIIDEEIKKTVYDVDINFNDGHAEINFVAKNHYSAKIYTVFSTIYRGFQLLQNNYPQIVHIR